MPVQKDQMTSRKLDYERDKDDVTAFLVRNQAYLIYQDGRASSSSNSSSMASNSTQTTMM